MRALILALALAGCAARQADPTREGAPVDVYTPQAADQCVAQPALDWCDHARR